MLKSKNNKLTLQIIADHLCMSKRNVSDVLKNLKIDYKKKSLSEIRESYIKYLRAVASGHQSEDGKIDLVHEKGLSERVQRQRNLIALSSEIGALCPVDDIQEKLNSAVIVCRNKLMKSGGAIAKDISEMHGIKVDQTIITGRLVEGLRALERTSKELKQNSG